jgi:hypothetical protein
LRILPHTGLINESLPIEEALLMRARLHTRGGWIRLSEGRTEDAVAAIYDALSSAMQRFLFQSVSGQAMKINKNEDPSNDLTLFTILKRSGIFDESVNLDDFMYIYQTLDDALENRLSSFDETRFIEITNKLLVNLDVLPFDMSDLPDSTIL